MFLRNLRMWVDRSASVRSGGTTSWAHRRWSSWWTQLTRIASMKRRLSYSTSSAIATCAPSKWPSLPTNRYSHYWVRVQYFEVPSSRSCSQVNSFTRHSCCCTGHSGRDPPRGFVTALGAESTRRAADGEGVRDERRDGRRPSGGFRVDCRAADGEGEGEGEEEVSLLYSHRTLLAQFPGASASAPITSDERLVLHFNRLVASGFSRASFQNPCNYYIYRFSPLQATFIGTSHSRANSFLELTTTRIFSLSFFGVHCWCTRVGSRKSSPA